MKKASRYNHFIMHNNSVIAYNARTNALAELEKEMNITDGQAHPIR